MTTKTAKKEATISPRVQKEKDALLSAIPQIDTERAKILMEVYQNNGTDPIILKRAKVFNRLCAEKTLFIDDNPIVGTLTKYKYGAQLFPEEGCAWMARTDEFALERGKVQITPEVREWVDKTLAYWKQANIFNASRDIILQQLGVDVRIMGKTGVWTEITPHAARHMIFPDFDMVVNQGLNDVLSQIEEAEAKLDVGETDGLAKYHFYEAAKLAVSGVITLAKRHAALARDMAKKEKNAARKKELEEIAEICEHVPANPARNFREATQSYFFTMLGVWLEAEGSLNSPPVNFTKVLNPFYLKEKEEGSLTTEQAIEIVHFFFLACNRLATVLSPHGYRFNQSRLGLQMGMAGFTPDGEDATNEMDYLILEAQKRIQMPEPLINLVYHDKLSEDFLLKCVDLLRTGIGQPAFHSGRVGIERHLFHHGMPLEEARTFAIGGCVQSCIPGYSDGYWYMRFNLAKMIEFVLENGNDPLSGLQIGLQTGDANNFKTYDEFYQAFTKQMEHFIPLTHDASRVVWNVQRNFPTPFGSAVVHDCIEKGKDVSEGGARYPFGDGVCYVGAVDAANSLATIKKLVFEDKKITMKQLREALAADFVGYEDIERMCLEAPKYGNDDDYADSITKNLYNLCYELTPQEDHLGRRAMPSAYSVSAHTACGIFTGALPNGKKSKGALADASVSAQPGTDTSGPTALVKSAAKVLDGVKYSSTHFNMKFHPTALKGTNSARKLLSLIKTYFDLGGYHVQFNCVSSETMKEAKLHPEDYRDLVVRVAGFSAFFIHLDEDVQDEIIKRTELIL
ncbi:MAG: glycyl radical protein [Chloroflexi bacterium]|nr:glycyl radical protein [Chloroflexota bacterium]